MMRPCHSFRKALIVVSLLFLAATTATAAPLIIQLSIDGDINPAVAGYINRGLDTAEERRAELALITMDTPGGQLSSTREITSRILDSTVPVAVWIGPEGARAASAGTFITYAAHVSAMAPSTHLGAAHPVALPGMPTGGEKKKGQGKTMEKKAVNDAVAYIRSLAEKRGRNADWAETAVTESKTASASKAVKLDIVEFIAADVNEFAEKADGRKVDINDDQKKLETADARFERLEMTWREQLLGMIANPNVAYLLMIIGFYGIIFELKAPGFGPGVAGVICLILGLYGLSVLPFDWAGLALILAGIGMLLAELYTPTHGLLGIGGLIAFVVGSLILVDAPATPISRPLIAGVAVGTGAFFLFALAAIVQGQKRPVATGRGALVGETGTVRRKIDPEGSVYVHGSLWTAVSDEGPLPEGEEIVVVEELPHMKLKVEPVRQ